MRILKIIALGCMSLAVLSCEEQLDENIKAQSTNLLVVEGMLTNERVNHKITLTLPHAQQNDEPLAASGAFVAIIDSDENVTLLRELPRGSGNYYTDSLRAVFGKFYLLFIRYQGQEYRAIDTPPPGQLLPPLQTEEVIVNNTPQRKIVFEESGTAPSYTDYYINWSNTSQCVGQPANCRAKLAYYDLKNIDVQEIYAPDKAPVHFPVGSRIIRKRYSTSEAYTEYLRSILSETEWRGGAFDIERNNVPTNLSEGAVGFFAVTAVVTDTTFVE